MDEAFNGLTNHRNVVNDLIIFNDDESNYVNHVRQFVQRCSNTDVPTQR